ncbi:S8 family peptidase [Dorea ammoniilytica]|uniref:S8 family peptidase n=1 Tax=Dorea ammoniilytica TaxID=2981788 RepID=A0ABT2S6W0_9FIRM|nr:S8 family peptidase [Dorea ammoniilytica]MCU6700319.1 S8 family peptidase [Dorea ammoniilytica]SCH79908.1 type VII secretion-associated serine protease mycosin [uncultured Eubacterium sp.]
MDLEMCRAQILSNDYRDFIVSTDGGRISLPALPEEVCSQEVGAGYEIVYLNKNIAEPIDFDRYVYNAVPQCYGLLDMDVMNQAGISQVQYYPTLNVAGEGIMIGFVDTGIDYTNPVFRKLDGSTRIVRIWDQTIQDGSVPDGFSYGSEYTEEMINQALQSENPKVIVPSEDTITHGTFVASLACGSGNAESRFLGAAPESTIAMVKLKPAKRYLRDFYAIAGESVCYQENDIMLGIRYLRNLAQRYQMPLVICLAVGTSFGGHNGNNSLDFMLQIYANSSNQIIVSGTGNEANQRHHYQGKIEALTERREIELQVGTGVDAFSMELWAELPNLIAVSVISPSGEVLPRISVRQSGMFSFRFLFEQTTVQVYNQILSKFNSAQLIFMRFLAPVPGIWRIVAEPVRLADGIFHLWLPMKEFLTGNVIFLESDPDTTLTGPGTTSSVITAAYYNGDENSIDINSGRGYTRLNNVKPDFAVPGVNVTGALPGGRFAERSGSSIGTAIAAGASALLLEWLLEQEKRSAGYDTTQLKGLFILGARKRTDIEYPDKAWGYGALDLYETLRTIREL